MSIEPPPLAAAAEAAEAAEAAAELLARTLIHIRYLTAPLIEDQSPEALLRRRDAVHELADICHNLPGLLTAERRHSLVQGLRWMWRTSSPRKRRWILSVWDDIGYDHRWLTKEDAGNYRGHHAT